ncbi:cytochrome P450 [Auriscalpium vulgare]|uniref:Cytochrome P450 n=1 Tax=Auriscalpium vulgare TaxID=40419 RepID=A0ACB8SCV6_9AGAM|nr:cytochrome P450 [Auriscalpium vulgare]
MPSLSTFVLDHLVVIIGSLVALYIVLNAIYQLVLSPLSDIPGPWYAAISDFWLTTHVLRLQQCRTIDALFEEYGPVVRVGPNKVVFNDLSTTKSVYTVHKFDKSTYYKSVLTNNNDHAMTTLPHAQHAIRKKGYAPHYNPDNLATFQPEVHSYTLQLVDVLDRMSGNPLDCLALFRQFMVDIISVSSFGYHVGAVSKWATVAEDPLATAIGDFPKRGILRSAVPTWAWNIVCRIPNKRWRQLCDSDRIMAEFVSARVYETRSQMVAGDLEDSEKVTLVQRLLRYHSGLSSGAMSDRDIISEHMGHLQVPFFGHSPIAGSDTTSTTVSYLCWELTRRADIVQKLQAEIDAAMPDSKGIPDISTLQKLPYLNAFVKEGLRVYSAAPSLLERVVPSSTTKNGAHCEAFDLMGFALPPGTVVATQGWSMHRNASVFPSPETFLPDRWLETDGNADQLAIMAQHMMPFGTGSRVCGGQNLAQIMLRVAVAAIVRNFDIVTPPETTQKSMEMRDSFVIFPASMSCRLTFNARKNR